MRTRYDEKIMKSISLAKYQCRKKVLNLVKNNQGKTEHENHFVHHFGMCL